MKNILFIILFLPMVGISQNSPSINSQVFFIDTIESVVPPPIGENSFIRLSGSSNSEFRIQEPPATDYQINKNESFSVGFWFRSAAVPGGGIPRPAGAGGAVGGFRRRSAGHGRRDRRDRRGPDQRRRPDALGHWARPGLGLAVRLVRF